MLIGLHSVLVEVGDLEAAADAYAQLLDRGADAEPGGRCAVFGVGNTRLELRSRVARGAPIVPNQDGLVGLRLAFRAEPGGCFAEGPLASPTVPLELVAGSVLVADDATGGQPAGAGIVGLDHVVIATRDPERTRAFLADELGIRLALDRTFPERGLRLLFFRLGGVTLELAAALAPPPADGGGDAFHGLAWKVRGLESTRARLVGAGFALSAIRPGHKAGTRVCSLQAPLCGVPTLLIEHPPRPGEGRSWDRL